MMYINLDIDLTDYFTNKYTIAKEIINIKQSINNMIMENVTVDIVSKTIDAVDNNLIETREIINEETNEPQQIIYQYANEYVKNKIANSRTQNLPHVFSTRNGFTSDYVESIKMSDIKPFNIDPSIFEKPSKKQKKKVITEKNIQGIQFIPSKQSEVKDEFDVSKFTCLRN